MKSQLLLRNFTRGFDFATKAVGRAFGERLRLMSASPSHDTAQSLYSFVSSFSIPLPTYTGGPVTRVPLVVSCLHRTIS